MAKWINWTPTQERMWAEWITQRPEIIQTVAREHNLRGDLLYRLKNTDQHVTLHSFSEDGTLTVNVLDAFNQHLFVHRAFPGFNERHVFGILPSDLEECDYDGPVEDGAAYLEAEGIKEDPVTPSADTSETS